MDAIDLFLPDDNEYHAMFSFHSDDRAWVRKTLETLEAEPYGLKCCISDRDFHPGQDVLHNIETCMQKSMNIILVISPEHLQSHYCDFETNMAMELCHQRKARVIPVLRRGETVPSSLRFINYVDARDDVEEKEVMEKLIKAITQGLDTLTTTYSLVQSSEFPNGEEVQQAAVRNRKRWNDYLWYSFTEFPEEKTSECQSLGIKLTGPDITSLRRLLNSCQFIRDNWIIFTHMGRLVIFFYLLVLICVLLTLLIIPKNITEDIFFTSIVMYGGLLEVTCILFGLVTPAVYIMAKRKKDNLSGAISLATYKKNVLVCIGDKNCKPVVRLVAYNVTQCQDYVKKNLLSILSGDPDDSKTDEIAQTIIKKAIMSYVKVLIYASSDAPRRRHMAKGSLICLCQYIEMENIHTKVLMKLQQPPPTYMGAIRYLVTACCRNRRRNRDSSKRDFSSVNPAFQA